MYAAHNQHMLAYAALMTGQSKLAMRYVREMIKDLPSEFVKKTRPWSRPLARYRWK